MVIALQHGAFLPCFEGSAAEHPTSSCGAAAKLAYFSFAMFWFMSRATFPKTSYADWEAGNEAANGRKLSAWRVAWINLQARERQPHHAAAAAGVSSAARWRGCGRAGTWAVGCGAARRARCATSAPPAPPVPRQVKVVRLNYVFKSQAAAHPQFPVLRTGEPRMTRSSPGWRRL